MTLSCVLAIANKRPRADDDSIDDVLVVQLEQAVPAALHERTNEEVLVETVEIVLLFEESRDWTEAIMDGLGRDPLLHVDGVGEPDTEQRHDR